VGAFFKPLNPHQMITAVILFEALFVIAVIIGGIKIHRADKKIRKEHKETMNRDDIDFTESERPHY
jgi:hypothetical protein